MLVGTGIDDQNIDADITSVGYDLSIKTTDQSQTFDLYLFSGNNSGDYDCYVMGAQLWADYAKVQDCDFFTMRPDIVQAGISEYSEASSSFLDSHALTDEVFIVIDNTGYYSALTQVDAEQT